MNLGRYRLVAQLGAGKDGATYRAETDEGSTAEVRVLAGARADAERWAALFRRIKLAALVGHPAALAVLETTLDHDPPFVAVEWREVQSLREISVSSDEAARIMRSIAGALAAAHRVGLVHGHLSPTCMHFEGPRNVKIDFTGVQTDSAEPEAVYRAPEMKAGEPPSPPGDVYSLGVLFRQLLVGQARVPVSLDRLVTDMLHADASARPSARQVEERLGAMLDLCGTVDSVVDTKESAGAAGASLGASRTIDTPGAQGSVESTPAIQQQERLRILEPGATRPFDTDSLPHLGRFLLLEKLGEGGMGAVYRAEDPVDGSIVAIKVLRAGFVGQPMALKRFHKEARLLAEVNNPYVTNLLEVNEDEGIHYLVMEFVAGRSLDVLLDERGRLEETMALTIMADVARALVEAHQRGIVHRDVKPENVLLAEPTDGQAQGARAVKLSDFGLARHVAETESLMVTQAGSVVGTPAYMSPEQCSGLPLDPRSDVYSMGATLFTLLAGRPPFEGDSPLVLMGKHANEPPPSLMKLVPELNEGVCQIVEKTLAKAPEARYADAAALLRDIERVLRGEPTSIIVHPKLPECDPARVLHYDWTWELDAAPQQLWPHVSNTERLNRAVGLPAVQFSTKTDGERVKRYGRFRKAGMTAAWEEHPFEWIEARRFGVLRQYSQGPFKWLMSVVELSPRSGGGTTLAHRVRIEPVGLLGRTAAAVEVGIRGRRAVERVYRRIDNYLTGKLGTPADVDPFEESASLSGGKLRRLELLLDRLSEYRVDPAVVERLGEFLTHAPAQEVARIRPLALARRWSLPAEQVVAACLHGAREGLFVLLWDILCPICRIPSEIKDTLRELREHGHCSACNIDYELDFAQSVEMIFRVHPEVRETELGTYCIGGPAHSPHVVAQVRVAPGERIELDLALGEGAYRLRGPQLPYALDFRVQSSGQMSRWELSLARAPGPDLPRVLRTGAQVFALTNNDDQELVARVERAAQRDDALTAARAASLALFRELFPDEVLSPGQLISVANVTLLVTALHGARVLYDTLGDAKAFGLLHDHFRQLDDCIRREGGALVKTIGEGVLAAFSDAASALRVALHLPALPLGEGQRPGVVIHRGPAMAATINDHLDYFGATVNNAMELRDTVRGGELLLTPAVANDPAVAVLLRERGLEGVVSEGFVQRVTL